MCTLHENLYQGWRLGKLQEKEGIYCPALTILALFSVLTRTTAVLTTMLLLWAIAMRASCCKTWPMTCRTLWSGSKVINFLTTASSPTSRLAGISSDTSPSFIDSWPTRQAVTIETHIVTSYTTVQWIGFIVLEITINMQIEHNVSTKWLAWLFAPKNQLTALLIIVCPCLPRTTSLTFEIHKLITYQSLEQINQHTV